MIQIKADNLEKEKQQQEKADQAPPPDAMNVDTDMDFESSQMDASLNVDMMETDQPQSSQNASKESAAANAIDEEDMEELLQIQRDRLDRLKNVIVLGMDADAVKANGRDGDKEDLLFQNRLRTNATMGPTNLSAKKGVMPTDAAIRTGSNAYNTEIHVGII